MEEGLLSLLCRRYFPDKVINDFDFLNLFPINLVYFAYQNLADKAVQYGFVQLLNRCVLADFPDKASYDFVGKLQRLGADIVRVDE